MIKWFTYQSVTPNINPKSWSSSEGARIFNILNPLSDASIALCDNEGRRCAVISASHVGGCLSNVRVSLFP